MLLEMPFFRWNTAIWETMRTIISWDEYVPILAHIDRYPQEDIARLLEMGYSAQINSAFFLRFGAKSFWKPLAENGILQAIGSDIHGRDVNSIARAYRKLGKYKETLSRRSRNLLQHATRLEDAVRLKKPSLTEEAAEKGKTSTAAEESK